MSHEDGGDVSPAEINNNPDLSYSDVISGADDQFSSQEEESDEGVTEEEASSSSSNQSNSGGGGTNPDTPERENTQFERGSGGGAPTPVEARRLRQAQKKGEKAKQEEAREIAAENTAEELAGKVEGEKGFPLSEKELEKRIKKGETEDLAPEIPGGASLSREQKIQVEQQLRQQESGKKDDVVRPGNTGSNQETSAPADSEVINPGQVVEKGEEAVATFTQNVGGLQENLQQSGDAFFSLGTEIMEEGGQVGDRIEKEFENVVPGESGAEDVAGDVVGGIGTVGTQASGFFVAGAGGLASLTGEATQDPVDAVTSFGSGVAGFAGATGSQLAKDPVGFAAEEGGEEIGEAVVGGLLAGPVGIAAGAAPTPEVEPEIRSEIEPEQEPSTEQELQPEGTSPEPEQTVPETEQLPSGFTRETSEPAPVESFQAGETRETNAGLEQFDPDAGQEVVPDQPRAEPFTVETSSGETAEARARPIEPDPGTQIEEFRGENPETGFTETEQEIIRESRGREDVTLRQQSNIDQEPEPGKTRKPGEQTRLQVEESESGSLLMASVVPVPVSPEPETEINPQPVSEGPEIGELDTTADLELDTSIGPELEPETETEVTGISEPEPEIQTDISTPFLEPGIQQDEPQTQENPPLEDQPAEEFQPPINQPEPQPEPEPEPEPEQEPFVFEPDPQLKQEPEIVAETNPQPEPDSSEDSDEEDQALVTGLENVDQEEEFRTSLAGLAGFGSEKTIVTEEEAEGELLTGLEIRD